MVRARLHLHVDSIEHVWRSVRLEQGGGSVGEGHVEHGREPCRTAPITHKRVAVVETGQELGDDGDVSVCD